MNCKSSISKIVFCLKDWEEGDRIRNEASREEYMKAASDYVYDKLKDTVPLKLIKEISLKEFYKGDDK